MPVGTTWTRPAGGLFVWATLPSGLNSKAMVPRAIAARVAYVPGTGFYADGTGAAHLRLSYCFPTPERIREGVRRLAAVVEQEVSLRSMFGPDASANADGSAVTWTRATQIGSRAADTPGPGLK
jgi:2-aminoadipate transaminase